MKSIHSFLILLIFFSASCGMRPSVPSNQENACQIIKFRNSWIRAINKTYKKYGISAGMQLSFILTESNFRPRAKTSRKYFLGLLPSGRLSSAFGYAQVIDSTWEWYQKSSGNRFSSRTSFADSVDFIGWYANQSESKLGISKSDVYNQYLAYHQGHKGFSLGKFKDKPNLINAAKTTEKNAKKFNRQLRHCL